MKIDYSNIDRIKTYISNNEIIYIDIRWLNKSLDIYSCVSLSPTSLALIFSDIVIVDSFEDPFLLHKTLVLIIQNPLKLEFLQKFNYVEFTLEDDLNTNKALEIIFLSPELDNNRDIRSEICMTLAYIGINVLLHKFDSTNNTHKIYFEKNTLNIDYSKIKYSIAMLCKTYNKKFQINPLISI